MNRRDFFGYPSSSSPTLAGAQTPRPDFDRVAPPAAPFSPAERHMRQVELPCDILVAGGGLAGACAAISAPGHHMK